MSAKRRKLSGSAYRKLASDKREKETNLLKSIKRVDSFFKPAEKNQCEEGGRLIENPGSSSENKNTQQYNTSYSVDSVVTSNLSLAHSHEQTQTVASQTAIENSDTFAIHNLETNSTIRCISDDPNEWEVNDTTIDELLHRGIDQNKDSDFTNSKRVFGNKTRFLNSQIFSRKLINGEFVSRGYLVYSKSNRTVFCAPCRLFGQSKTNSKLASEGVSDWKNISNILSAHENSEDHINSELELLTRKKEYRNIKKLV